MRSHNEPSIPDCASWPAEAVPGREWEGRVDRGATVDFHHGYRRDSDTVESGTDGGYECGWTGSSEEPRRLDWLEWCDSDVDAPNPHSSNTTPSIVAVVTEWVDVDRAIEEESNCAPNATRAHPS